MPAYPRSPTEMTSGMMWFPRMVDKIRLHARGQLDEVYHPNMGHRKAADGACLNFLRINYSELKERVLAGGTDEEILEWCFERGRRLNEGDLVVWNGFISKFGWNDHATAMLNRLKERSGLSDRADIITIPQLIDLDEGRLS